MGKQAVGWIILVGCLGLVGWLAVIRHRPAGTNPNAAPDKSPAVGVSVLTVDYYEYFRSSSFDPGTVRLLLRNVGAAPLRLRKITWDGLPLSTWGVDIPLPEDALSTPLPESETAGGNANHNAALDDGVVPTEAPSPYRPAYWARWTREGAFPPGEVAWLLVKLVQPLTHPTAIRIEGGGEGEHASGILLSQRIVARPPAFRLHRLTFTDDGREVFIYGENLADTAHRIVRVELDGKVVREGLWLPQAEVPTGRRMVAGLRSAIPFPPGASVTVRLVMADGTTAAGRAGAYRGFPLGTESGIPPPGWAGAVSCRLSGTPPADGTPPRDPVDYCWRAMSCVVCANGLKGTVFDTAREMLRRRAWSHTRAPGIPVAVNPCRVTPEYGYALFAETADVLLVNPAVDTGMDTIPSSTSDPRPSLDKTIALARVARDASAPGLFYAVFSSNTVDRQEWEPASVVTPAALRARAYALLSTGADGLFLRHNSDVVRLFAPGLDNAVNELAGELRQLSPWLPHSAAWGSAEVEGLPGVRACLRWAGREGCLLLLVADEADGKAPPRRADGDFMGWVTVDLPAWVSVADVSRVGSSGLVLLSEIELNGPLRFRVSAPTGGAAYWVRFATPREEGTDE